MAAIQFFFHHKTPFLKERKRLREFLKQLFIKEKRRLGSVAYIFCSDEFLLDINRKFLKHDFYTDTISFDLSTSPKIVEGEIYISYDRVKENARERGVSFSEELHRVIFHGSLHLCGFNDKKMRDRSKMTGRENKYLDLYLN